MHLKGIVRAGRVGPVAQRLHTRQHVIARVASPQERNVSVEGAIRNHYGAHASTPVKQALPLDEAAACQVIDKHEELYKQRQARKERRAREQSVYRASAIAASLLFMGIATFATFYRFFYHHSFTDSFPYLEFFSTLAMIGGGVVYMEMYARWAHRVLWHDFKPGWALHKSHHEPRTGPFEKNDIFAVINAVPAIALTAYGFLTPTQWGGLCFGFGMGITTFGIMYMFIHDGLVHKRFPVGPIAEVPQLKRIAVAHRLHHSEKYGGVPFGMFLGPQELESIGAGAELDRLVEEMTLTSKALK